MNPLFHTDFSISDSLKSVRKSVLIYETIIIELEGKHPSLGLLAYIATIFDMPIDPYIFPEKADDKSAVRKRLDVLLDKLCDRDLSILEATAAALCKAKEQPED